MVRRNLFRRKPCHALAFVCCVLLAGAARAIAAPVQLSVTGSTLLVPLFNLWIPDYVASRPSVTITTQAAGSGAGINAAISGAAQIGISDAYMSDEEAERNPQIVNIPLAISSQTVNYNVPGIAAGTALKLDGPAIAGIYSGTIREWDAAPIRSLNPGVALPHRAIVPIRRADASGDTFIFAQFLEFSTPGWAEQIRSGMTIDWPAVPGEMKAVGNTGMVQATAATPYSIAYIGISLADDVAKAHLGTAMIRNQNGEFLLPTPDTVSAAASALDTRTPPDGRLSLVFAPGPDSYPLISYEYAVVSTRQPDMAVARAIRDFLRWANSPVGGNTAKYLDAVHFVAIPDFLRAMNEKQIAKIK